MIRVHPERYFRTDIIARAFTCWTVSGTVVQQSLARLLNSHWHDCSTVQNYGQQSMARLMNSRWNDFSTVTGTIVQQLLAWLFNSGWHDSSTVTGIILQQSPARFFNSHWHNSSTVTGTIVQQSLARFFNSGWHDSSTVTGKIFSFFYAGRIPQQWSSLLKNCAMYQEHDTWSVKTGRSFKIL